MSEKEEKSIRKGCMAFLVVVLALALGAGLSVLLKGKKMKPKSRALVVSRPRARLEEVKKKLSSDISIPARDDFIGAFTEYTKALETYGAGKFDSLGRLGDELDKIEADGIITEDEARDWTRNARPALEER